MAVDWKGLTLQVNFTSDMKAFKGTLNVPGVEVVAKDINLKVREVKSDFNMKEGVSDLSLGDVSLSLTDLEFVETEEAKPSTSVTVPGYRLHATRHGSGDASGTASAAGAVSLELVTEPGPGTGTP